MTDLHAAAGEYLSRVPGAVETAPRTRKDTGTDVPTTNKPARKSAATAGK